MDYQFVQEESDFLRQVFFLLNSIHSGLLLPFIPAMLALGRVKLGFGDALHRLGGSCRRGHDAGYPMTMDC